MVIDIGYPAVFQINLETGTRLILSSDTMGIGPLLGPVSSLAVDPTGAIFAGSFFTILQIDALSGNRSVVSGGVLTPDIVIFLPEGLAVETMDTLVMVDSLTTRVTRVDLLSGLATVISDDGIGLGPSLFFPVAIAVEADGMLVVTDITLRALIRIDPLTGDRMMLSGPRPEVSLETK